MREADRKVKYIMVWDNDQKRWVPVEDMALSEEFESKLP